MKTLNKHCYAVPHVCVGRKTIEEADEDGLPVQRIEDVDMLQHKLIETAPYSHYSLKAQIASNQPIKRINTLTLNHDELSGYQMQQLSNLSALAHVNDDKADETKTE